jgi:quercetin dioxygenase-like cupin family protein
MKGGAGAAPQYRVHNPEIMARNVCLTQPSSITVDTNLRSDRVDVPSCPRAMPRRMRVEAVGVRGQRRNMRDHLYTTHRRSLTRINSLAICLAVILLILASLTNGSAADKVASNKQPLSFGTGQTIIDLQKVVWEPLRGEGIPPGVQIAMLRGDLAAGGGELLVRLPANYTFPNHSHTSDELYVWIQGDFTYIAEGGTATPLSKHAYISLPGNVPHALKCGKSPCIFYVRYSGPFDYKIHPMPTRKK